MYERNKTVLFILVALLLMQVISETTVMGLIVARVTSPIPCPVVGPNHSPFFLNSYQSAGCVSRLYHGQS